MVFLKLALKHDVETLISETFEQLLKIDMVIDTHSIKLF